MPSLAATATQTITLTALPTAALVLLTLGYIGLCWLLPFRRCQNCTGTGWTRTPLLRRTRPCRRCNGDGVRLRVGRRLFNHFAHLRRNAR
ncbi:hypothetical protein ACFQZ4_54365 [Catellatospora coxensis]|uniref:Uncharacterized protein n=1 Tax=Catellatospora coxensis TaxID=310354 RepID=A0A8J3KY01_9ACTN|nr:hypothetical protein Cco03nite_77670 [Catellatospora coxensis]